MSRQRRPLESWLERIMRIVAVLSLSLLIPFAVCARLVGAQEVATSHPHPGNIYLAGESVRVSVPAAWHGWRAVDIDGEEISRGEASNQLADMGALSIGYYEVLEEGGPGKFSIGVVAKNVPVDDTPIALDAAMSWFYAEPQQLRDACRLCQLAGVKWVRDRLSWPELQPSRGAWADEGRYEQAMRIQHEAGLKVLQVNHASPSWATSNPARFPEDLSLVYNFYRGLAARWKHLADAIEPWNEPDIELFGGHTGCEIASFHKAAYLGLKAGDPAKPVCGTVFAIDRPETLDEFAANEPQPYFQRYNLHHYIRLTDYPRAYGRHRKVNGGRPMWTTEFNLPVHWADEATKEPSHDELRVQGYRVAKVFSTALHEGVDKAFYFILGDYVERNLQYGLVHHDLTPRPAYIAFAAVGRLLNGAAPIGRVNLGDDLLKAYVFRTQVDGAARQTIVAWSETRPSTMAIKDDWEAFDYLGRQLPRSNLVELTRAPIFAVLPADGSPDLALVPPPTKAIWNEGSPSPVVLQLLGAGDVVLSAFKLDTSGELRLIAYNFGNQTVSGALRLTSCKCLEPAVTIEPGGRVERTLTTKEPGAVSVRLDMKGLPSAVVYARVVGS